MAWDFDKVITNDQLTAWLRAAGYDTAVEGECADLRVRVGYRCSGEGTIDGQEVRVNVTVDPTARTSTIHLSVS